ncbi:uncharacterized protein LOC133202272 [Saccostrea echinata]|uniref:uncharacterized protein LOC133202272 n=1 Tax=Saccostrea echinata TaxID=191078 RepID=UPI002A8158F3|nr:uncharacterized protein LOC133202272 [Saccostrea echinata]
MKKDTWERVTEQLNVSSSTPRTVEEVEKKWQNILSTAKSEISSYRKEATATGGGPPSKPLSAVAETVQMVIGETNSIISGIDGGIDSSEVLHLFTDENVCSIQFLQEASSNNHQHVSSASTSILPLSPGLLSPTPTSTSPLPVVTQKSPLLPRTIAPVMSRKPSQSKQDLIEELTVKKLKLEIEYFNLKVKALQRKLEE